MKIETIDDIDTTIIVTIKSPMIFEKKMKGYTHAEIIRHLLADVDFGWPDKLGNEIGLCLQKHFVKVVKEMEKPRLFLVK